MPNFFIYGAQYVARDPGKSYTVKDKSTYILDPRQGDRHLSNKSSNIASSDGNQNFDENGMVDICFLKFHVTCFSLLSLVFYFVAWTLRGNNLWYQYLSPSGPLLFFWGWVEVAALIPWTFWRVSNCSFLYQLWQFAYRLVHHFRYYWK